jgi:succinyl-diaminopimelate desuccinylase
LNFSLKLTQGSFPFVTSEESYIVKAVQNALLEVTGSKAKLSTAGGTSDARYISQFGIDSIECGVRNDTIHGINERCGMDEVEKLEKVFLHVIENFKIQGDN